MHAAQRQDLLNGTGNWCWYSMKAKSINSGVKRSWPASTGVWVVKMHCARVAASASENFCPAASFSRINSSVRKAAWPSFM